ncbi:MAG: glycerol-3-phosphate 1-O-acyltransferase PlsY [Candidatus Heimdallarchaeota archaeon]|nr:glycerol-3-phosphate 1-O-acyltransferase PlsY [Candidatus Heimdallarchaeota archaeon]MDH5646503.1 glycerol-3-phosphate 1-O-acyltransferase PlsY [Candidatus Heimdallarchaeota archaeon]
MSSHILSLFMIISSYLIGSIPPAYLIAKFKFGINIKEQGSGNVGGANSARLMGKNIGILVGVLDVLKGTLAVLLTKVVVSSQINGKIELFTSLEVVLAFSGIAAVLGHCFSIFLKFKAGKGMATTGGVVLALDPISFLILLGVMIVLVFVVTKITSLSNLIGVILVPILLYISLNVVAYLVMGIILVGIIYYTHRENIRRLFAGNERKIGQKEEINRSKSI